MGRFERVGHMGHRPHDDCPGIYKPRGNERDLPAWSYNEITGEQTFYLV